jgi:hypothetical protein
VGHFVRDEATGEIMFRHVMIAELNGHLSASPDWKRLGSKVNPTTGSQRTETYVTTLSGTTKLRHGSIYLDPVINFSRWRRPKGTTFPEHSIFHPDNFPKKPGKRKRP